jgi:cytochrome b561
VSGKVLTHHGVVVLHISSALLHHYAFKDDVLSAMLPGKSKVSFAKGDKIIP